MILEFVLPMVAFSLVTEIEKMNRRFDVEYCRKWVGHVLDSQEEVVVDLNAH